MKISYNLYHTLDEIILTVFLVTKNIMDVDKSTYISFLYNTRSKIHIVQAVKHTLNKVHQAIRDRNDRALFQGQLSP